MIQFKNIDEVDQYFTERGFHAYTSPFTSNGVVRCYQKKYTDQQGIRYFIDVDIWYIPDVRMRDQPYSAEFNGQYYASGTHEAVNMTFIGWNLEQVENFLNKQFDAGILEHYERESDDT